MKKSDAHLFIFVITLWLISYSSCKKLDTDADGFPTLHSNVTFFNNTAHLSTPVLRIVTLMRQKEPNVHFTTDFIKKQGVPLWQAAKVYYKAPASAAYRNLAYSQSTDTIIKIPLQLQGVQAVHGYLLCTLSASGVAVAVIDGRQYAQYGFLNDAPNEVAAENIAAEIMQFNYAIFGYNHFVVTDKRLFGHETGANVIRTVRFDSAANNDVGSRAGLCPGGRVTVSVTTTVQHCPYPAGQCTGPNGTCDDCTEYNCATYSTEVYSFCNQDAPPSSSPQAVVWTLEQPTDPAGGGVIPPGWLPTPADPCITTTAGAIATTVCGLGWNVGPTLLQEPVSDVYDSIPNILARACNRQLDSVFNWGLQNNNREQSFILVRKNGVIYPKNFLPGSPNGDETRVNYLLAPGEELVAYVHTHPLPTLEERGSFSPEDFIELTKKRNIPGYTAILDCGDVRYALVIEDVAKLNTFTSTRRNTALKNGWVEAILTQPTIYNNPSLACENGITQYLGTASVCGIGFYKATNPNKTSFTKLNP